MATLTGALRPAPVKGERVRADPVLVKALTELALEPLFATQTLPEPSIAMLAGLLRPLPE